MATGLGSEKLQALRQLLATLPPETQGRLGEALSHIKQDDPSFPADLILEVLHPPEPLPEPVAAVPDVAPLDPEKPRSLREIATLALEPFVTDETLPFLVPGRIPRTALDPWWEAMIRMGCEEAEQLEAALARQYESKGDVAAFAAEARAKVHAWGVRFLDKLNKGKTLVPELRELFKEKLIREHVTEIVTILGCCEPILVALHFLAPRGRIADFGDEAAERAKPIYSECAARMQGNSRYLALALLNSFGKPYQMMRLANALGWTRAAGAQSRNADLTAICERLIPLAVEVANGIKAATAQKTTLTAGGADFEELRQHVFRYAKLADALAAEVDFRKDSAWGAQIIKSREAMRSAFDTERLEVIENIIVGFMPSVLEAEAPPPEPALSQATGAARLIMTVAHHGQRHGFANDANVLVGKLGKELEKLTEMLLTKPHGHEQQLDGAVKVLSILFQDVRTRTLAQRVNAALGRAAA